MVERHETWREENKEARAQPSAFNILLHLAKWLHEPTGVESSSITFNNSLFQRGHLLSPLWREPRHIVLLYVIALVKSEKATSLLSFIIETLATSLFFRDDSQVLRLTQARAQLCYCTPEVSSLVLMTRERLQWKKYAVTLHEKMAGENNIK